jgi:hypothetical protein
MCLSVTMSQTGTSIKIRTTAFGTAEAVPLRFFAFNDISARRLCEFLLPQVTGGCMAASDQSDG